MACLIIQLDLVDTFVPPLLGKFLAVEAFFVFLIVQFIRGLPRDMDEAARIDGCGHWRIFWLIILPLIKPALVSASIFAFIWSWNYVLGPLLYLNSPPTTTRCPQQRELRRRPRGQVLWVGILVAVASLPVVTWPAALAAGASHLRRFLRGESATVRQFVGDVRRAVPAIRSRR